MSMLTYLMLHVRAIEVEERMAEVNRFFGAWPPRSIEDVATVAGKPWVLNVYVGVYNFFPLERFLEHLRQIPWTFPDYVQLMVYSEEQEDRGFRVALEIETPPPAGLSEEEIEADVSDRMRRKHHERIQQILRRMPQERREQWLDRVVRPPDEFDTALKDSGYSELRSDAVPRDEDWDLPDAGWWDSLMRDVERGAL